MPFSRAWIALFIGVGIACSQEGSAQPNLPIPPDLVPLLQRSIDVGQSLYLLDQASAIGTDALAGKLGSLAGKGLIGYLTIQEADEDSKPRSSWLVVFFTDAGDPKIAYRIHVSMRSDVAPRVEVLRTPEHPDAMLLKLFRARQAALDAAGPFAQPMNPVVLPAEAIGERGVLVELLAGTTKQNIAVLGKHYRVIVSDNGRVDRVMPLSETALELTKDAKAVALTASHFVTDYPLETHVFASMLYHVPIYVGTKRGVWLLNKNSIALVSGPEPAIH